MSGAHFNPAVTLAILVRREISLSEAVPFWIARIAGGVIGVFATHLMFDQSVFQVSQTMRTGGARWWAEIIATFGLLMVIFGGIRNRPDAVPALVGLYITGAYWFTASTSFANPAVTIARSWTDTFAGISPVHAPMFILMQILGALAAVGFARIVFTPDE